MIHPTAVIHPGAQVAPDVTIGPYAVIDENVRIGAGCQIGPHVYITGVTQLGCRNRVHAGAVLGDLPQDVRFEGDLTGVVIGNDNVIREHVTIHRSNKSSEPTTIGSNTLLMAHCHVGHNVVVGDQAIVANGALLAGHSEVGKGAFISGNCLVHQFTRVGALALMQGGAAISKDLPPYTVARGPNTVCGLNVVGLRRAGFSSQERLELRRLYHATLRSRRPLRDVLSELQKEFTSEKAQIFLNFLSSSKRGFCVDYGGAAEMED
jgi:UDP-N-acetylglucosamine acyltransferase